MDNEPVRIPTKQKIVDCAIDLFASKGYTETSIREIVMAVGIKEASLYSHFPSKNSILEYILDEYSRLTITSFNPDKLLVLKDNPTADGILSCMQLVYAEGKEAYLLKGLYVILQEQHRNPLVRKFLCEEFILNNEKNIKAIFDALKKFGIIHNDTDPDFWVKTHSALLYTFSSRLMLGIGDSSPGFSGMNLTQMIWNLYDLMLKTCSIQQKS